MKRSGVCVAHFLYCFSVVLALAEEKAASDKVKTQGRRRAKQVLILVTDTEMYMEIAHL